MVLHPSSHLLAICKLLQSYNPSKLFHFHFEAKISALQHRARSSAAGGSGGGGGGGPVCITQLYTGHRWSLASVDFLSRILLLFFFLSSFTLTTSSEHTLNLVILSSEFRKFCDFLGGSSPPRPRLTSANASVTRHLLFCVNQVLD